MEKLFNFLFHYNIGLIEALLVLIGGLLIFMFYRVFFASTPVRMDGSILPAVNVNTTEIEKTLKQLMETQASSMAALEAKAASAGPGIDPEVQKENLELKHKMELKTQQVADLEKKLQESYKLVSETTEKAKSSNSGNEELEQKIKDLETRLQEYEIISEDISDLSKFKEENARLQAELEALRGAGATLAPTPNNVTPIKPKLAPVPEPEPVFEEPEIEVPVAERTESAASMFSGPASEPEPSEPAGPSLDELMASAPTTEPADSELFAGVPEMAVKPPDPDENEATMAGGSVIDDDLMKEFEAAVEDQKSGGAKEEAAPAGDAQLLDQFESFVKKA